MSHRDEALTTEMPGDATIAVTQSGIRPAVTSVPTAALWLGALGAVPFIALAGSSAVLGEPLRAQAVYALVLYGAVILSFLGGVHWGLAIAGFGKDGAAGALARRLTFSVVPSLIAWVALLLPGSIALFVLAGAFAAMVLYDAQVSRNGEAPAWYPTLRWPLSLAVVASLGLGALV